MSDYPECDKMGAVRDESQRIGEFLEWLGQQGVQRMRWHEWDETVTSNCMFCSNTPEHPNRYRCMTCHGAGRYEYVEHREGWVHDHRTIEQLLAGYFNIDLVEVERERRAMLAKLGEAA